MHICVFAGEPRLLQVPLTWQSSDVACLDQRAGEVKVNEGPAI